MSTCSEKSLRNHVIQITSSFLTHCSNQSAHVAWIDRLHLVTTVSIDSVRGVHAPGWRFTFAMHRPSSTEITAMENETTMPANAPAFLKATQVYAMATLCLMIGLTIGYLMRSSQLAVPAMQIAANSTQPHAAVKDPVHSRPSLEQMRQMSDKQAAPLLEKLKANPNDSALLLQIGAIYHTTHRFKEAADYYQRALEKDPRSVAIRTKLASSLYRNGDVDGAVAQLNQALKYEPGDANALFDLGMIKLQGQGDGKGAIAAWQRLLKSNPDLSPDRKATVLKLMADLMTMMGDQQGIEKPRSKQ
jgi:cytochrome c-type biogenesis protein CcmH/NrfG